MSVILIAVRNRLVGGAGSLLASFLVSNAIILITLENVDSQLRSDKSKAISMESMSDVFIEPLEIQWGCCNYQHALRSRRCL